MTAHPSGLTADQLDRAYGVALGAACGDALGAGYEFGSAQLGPEGPSMIGGGLGGFEPGEWTDDTTMAWCLLDGATVTDLGSEEGLTEVSRRFLAWAASGPPDIGIQTSRVLAGLPPTARAADLVAASQALHRSTGRTAGNGSLMRTWPVALACLDDELRCVRTAWAVSELTHTDPLAGEACVLWSTAVRRAVLDGVLDIRGGLRHLEPAAARAWAARLDEAEQDRPATLAPNGFVVTALQAAWAAIAQTPVPATPGQHLPEALRAAIAIGDDTDTVASIAGALLGARWGASAVPGEWARVLHGYPGITGGDLLGLVDRVLTPAR